MSEVDITEMKKDLREIKEEIVKLRVAQAVTQTRVKMYSGVFGLMGGLVVWMVREFLSKP